MFCTLRLARTLALRLEQGEILVVTFSAALAISSLKAMADDLELLREFTGERG
jgi:hypothetical protein